MNCQKQSYSSFSSKGVPIRNIADYSPFGVQLDGRTISMDSYRYGFNGMLNDTWISGTGSLSGVNPEWSFSGTSGEKDNEFKGQGNSYTTEFRQYDVRVGRWLSLDPKASVFASFSPFNAFINSPIIVIDVKGDIIKFANAHSEADYIAMYNLADNDFKLKLDKMDKSDIIFEVNTTITEEHFPS